MATWWSKDNHITKSRTGDKGQPWCSPSATGIKSDLQLPAWNKNELLLYRDQLVNSKWPNIAYFQSTSRGACLSLFFVCKADVEWLGRLKIHYWVSGVPWLEWKLLCSSWILWSTQECELLEVRAQPPVPLLKKQTNLLPNSDALFTTSMYCCRAVSTKTIIQCLDKLRANLIYPMGSTTEVLFDCCILVMPPTMSESYPVNP